MPCSLSRLAVLGVFGVTACSSAASPVDPGSATSSRAFGIWRPGPHDTCTRDQHDAYAVIGPDGKAYPTWHPPSGPGGCTFGHEHGRDPSGSNLLESAGGLPFGYANEMLALADPAHPRDEDHVGHKVEWENDVALPLMGGGTAVCDVLLKLHQGTHSRDAFSNNLHELVYHLRCDGGGELHVTMLAAIGLPGQFGRSCSETNYIKGGPPVPSNSPVGEGARYIPDRSCIDEHLLVPLGKPSNYTAALTESWNTSNTVKAAGGEAVAFFNPVFRVELPSRFFDTSRPGSLARSIDACYEWVNNERAGGGACDESTEGGTIRGLAYDDPRSQFTGMRRSIVLNAVRITNAGGPEIWHTDAFGANGRAEPFTGSIQQRISPVQRELGMSSKGPMIGLGRVYGSAGVHSPN